MVIVGVHNTVRRSLAKSCIEEAKDGAALRTRGSGERTRRRPTFNVLTEVERLEKVCPFDGC